MVLSFQKLRVDFPFDRLFSEQALVVASMRRHLLSRKGEFQFNSLPHKAIIHICFMAILILHRSPKPCPNA